MFAVFLIFLCIVGASLFYLAKNSDSDSDADSALIEDLPTLHPAFNLKPPITSNGGEAILITWQVTERMEGLMKRIEVQASDEIWRTELTGCDISNQAIANNKTCRIAIETLKS